LHMVGKMEVSSLNNNVASFNTLHLIFTWFIPLHTLLAFPLSFFHFFLFFSFLLFSFSFYFPLTFFSFFSFLLHTHIFFYLSLSLFTYLPLFRSSLLIFSCISTIWILNENHARG
jgi:hypothetical protein